MDLAGGKIFRKYWRVGRMYWAGCVVDAMGWGGLVIMRMALAHLTGGGEWMG